MYFISSNCEHDSLMKKSTMLKLVLDSEMRLKDKFNYKQPSSSQQLMFFFIIEFYSESLSKQSKWELKN